MEDDLWFHAGRDLIHYSGHISDALEAVTSRDIVRFAQTMGAVMAHADEIAAMAEVVVRMAFENAPAEMNLATAEKIAGTDLPDDIKEALSNLLGAVLVNNAGVDFDVIERHANGL